jgi:hypothetical protein
MNLGPYFELDYSCKIAYFTALEVELSIPMNYVTIGKYSA